MHSKLITCLASALALSAAALAGPYSYPTYAQIERLITLVKEGGGGGGGVTPDQLGSVAKAATNHTDVSVSALSNNLVRIAQDVVSEGSNFVRAAVGEATNALALAERTKLGETRTDGPYIRFIDYNDYLEEDVKWYCDRIDGIGYCSSVRSGNLYGRNYDWGYTDAMTYVGRLPATKDRFASLWVSSVGTNLTPAVEAAGQWTRFHRALPGVALDGINEKGVVCNINVVTTNGTPWEAHVDGDGRDLNILCSVRLVLDRFEHAADAAGYVADHAYIPKALTSRGYSIHMMVADETETWIVEDAEAWKVVSGPTSDSRGERSPIPMTNFRLASLADGAQDDTYGSGYERFALLAAKGPEDIASAWYKKAYVPHKDTGDYPWPTEFAGCIDANGPIPHTATARLQAWAKANVTPALPPARNGKWWQTVHSVVYDIAKRSMRIAVQEEPNWTVVSVYEDAARGVISITGIHSGETTYKAQYNKGVWTAPVACANDYTVEIGDNAHAVETASSNQSIAIGRDSLSSGSATVAVGPNSFAQKEQSVAVGWRANAVGSHSISIGGARKSGIDYYTPDGTVCTTSDLQLAEGDYAVAIGYNDKARAANSITIGYEAKVASNATGAVQLGTGENTAPNTLKFQDVVIVKDGHVTGAVPDPQQVDPIAGTVTETLEFTVAPGSMTTVVPTKDCGPGTEMGVSCSAVNNRNYTIFLPNEPQLRAGLPGSFDFELPSGVTGTIGGPKTFTTLPVRIAVEQPYGKLVAVSVTPLDDGYDWTPSVTNHNLAYRIDLSAGTSKLVTTNATQAILGESLHCATNVTISYWSQVAMGVPRTYRTVPILTLPAGKAYMSQTYYGYAGWQGDITVQDPYTPETKTRGSYEYIEAQLTYHTLKGSCSTNIEVEVITAQ